MIPCSGQHGRNGQRQGSKDGCLACRERSRFDVTGTD